MGRSDGVDFECDEADCTGHVTFHEPKERSFVPDGWSVTFELDEQTKEERAHYRCPSHG